MLRALLFATGNDAPNPGVERIFLDEPSGSIKSYSQRFEDVVGRPIGEYLGL